MESSTGFASDLGILGWAFILVPGVLLLNDVFHFLPSGTPLVKY